MENTAKRITKAQRYTDILSLLREEEPIHGTTIDEACEFIKYEMALLAKKNKGGEGKKLTQTQEENERYKELILEFLATQDSEQTCTQIAHGVPELAIYQNQKIASLARQLIEAGKVKRKVVKGKSVFSLA